MIDIRLTGVDETLDRLMEIGKRAQGGEIVAEATEYAYEETMRGIEPHSKTGTMERNLTHRVSKSTPEGRVYFDNAGMMRNGVNYAIFVHFGTRAHDIRPKKRRALRWESGSVFHFAKAVHHPGYKGDPFMQLAADKTFSKLSDIAQRIING